MNFLGSRQCAWGASVPWGLVCLGGQCAQGTSVPRGFVCLGGYLFWGCLGGQCALGASVPWRLVCLWGASVPEPTKPPPLQYLVYITLAATLQVLVLRRVNNARKSSWEGLAPLPFMLPPFSVVYYIQPLSLSHMPQIIGVCASYNGLLLSLERNRNAHSRKFSLHFVMPKSKTNICVLVPVYVFMYLLKVA